MGENKKMQITLKAARTNAGLTQEEAAKALKISPATYNKWENNPGSISSIWQRKISDVFKIPIDNIIFLIDT